VDGLARPEITIGATARLPALHRMIELFPDQPTITVVDDSRRPVGRVVVSAVSRAPAPGNDAALVRDVMVSFG